MVALLLLLSCGLQPVGSDACSSDAQCRDAFGFASTCSSEGTCERAEAHPRCTRTFPEDLWLRPEAYRDHYVVGSIFDMEADVPEVQSIQLALNEMNGAGGLYGSEVAMVQCDYSRNLTVDQLNETEAVQETADFLADVIGVPAILGPGTSGHSETAYRWLEGRDVLLISPSATSPKLNTIDGDVSTDDAPGLFWRASPPDDAQSVAIVLDMESRDVDDIAIIYQDNPYGSALAELVMAGHTGSELLFAYTDDNERTAAIQAAGSDEDVQEVLFIASDVQDVVAFLNSAALVSAYEDKTIFLTDSSYDQYLLDNVSASVANLYPSIRGSRPTTPSGAVYDAFLIAYASAYDGEDPSTGAYNAYAYDIGWMSLYGLSWALAQEARVSGTEMARGLRKLSTPGTSLFVGPEDWLTVVDAFERNQAIDIQGASGTLDFDPVTGETANPIDIWTVDETGFTVVKTCDIEGDCEESSL